MKALSLVLILSFIYSCQNENLEVGSLSSSITDKNFSLNNKQIERNTLNATVESISIRNNQLVISGDNLLEVSTIKIKGEGNALDEFIIEESTKTQLIANSMGQVAYTINKVFDLIISDASGEATFKISFLGSENLINPLNQIQAGVGQVLKYNGTNWVGSDLAGLTYSGSWNAETNQPDLSLEGNSGEFYIVSQAGSTNLKNLESPTNWEIGDWAIWNDQTIDWDKIENGNGVNTFNNRKGTVVPLNNDYTWAQIDKTNSPINDLSNVDTTDAITGSVLKFDGSEWIIGVDNFSESLTEIDSELIKDGSITNEDLAGDINTSKITDLDDTLNSKLNLDGSLSMSGNLDLGSNNITNVGTVNGLNLSALSTDDLSEGTKLFFTDSRASNAVILNQTAGTETDKAASISAMKNYVTSSIPASNIINNSDGTETDKAASVNAMKNYVTASIPTSNIINNSDGTETDKAASISAMKNYVTSSIPASNIINNSDGTETDKAASVNAMKNYVTASIPTSNIINNSDGTETDKAASISAMKNYVTSSIPASNIINNSDGTETDKAASVNAMKNYVTASIPTSNIINNSDGTETDKAASISAMKNYVTSSIPASNIINNSDGTETDKAASVNAMKNYVTASIPASNIINNSDGTETDKAASVNAMKTYISSQIPIANEGDITNIIAGDGLTGGSESGDATLSVDTGTGGNQIVKLDETGKLPAIDGSALQNIPAAQLAERLSSEACTLDNNGRMRVYNGNAMICVDQNWLAFKLETPTSKYSSSNIPNATFDIDSKTSSDIHTITITNIGSAPSSAKIITTKTNGDVYNFLISNNNCEGSILEPGETCQLSVKSSTWANGYFSTWIEIYDDGKYSEKTSIYLRMTATNVPHMGGGGER